MARPCQKDQQEPRISELIDADDHGPFTHYFRAIEALVKVGASFTMKSSQLQIHSNEINFKYDLQAISQNANSHA